MFFGESAEDPITFTVYVHGSKGIQDYVLENEGELLVDLNGDRRTPKIGEKGRTVFNEIPIKFKNQEIPIFVIADKFEPREPDKKYLLDGKAIYYPVQIKATLRTIDGIIINENGTKPLSDVKILIEHKWPITTDSTGRFHYIVDENQAKEKYIVSFQKENFQSETIDYYPNSTKEFRLKLASH